MDFKKYTAFFCEENIWQLTESIPTELLGNFNVLFLTNESKSIAVMNQKAAQGQSHIIWDYHVILHDTKQKVIYDFDSTLGMTTDEEEYFYGTFGNQNALQNNFRTKILAIPAKEYLQDFSSDRSHMIDETGKKVSPFPSWPKILQGTCLDLSMLMNLDKTILNKYPLLPVDQYLNCHQ